jgi:WD40 repeat protein
MKHHPPVLLILLGLIACSVPGFAFTSANLEKATPALTVTSTITPVPETTYPAITSANVDKLAEVKSIPVENINRLIWQPDSKAVTALALGELNVYDALNLTKIAGYTLQENTSLLDYDPESQLMALTSDRLKLEIRALDGNTDKILLPEGGFGAARFEPGGKRIWISSMDLIKVIAYDTTTGKEAAACAGFETAAPVYSAFPSPTGRWLVWTARATLQLNHLDGCKKAARFSHEDFISAHAFSSNDSLLAVSAGGELNGAFQPLIYLYDTETGSRKNVIPLKESPAMDLSFSPDSSVIAAAGSGLNLLNVKTGKVLKELSSTDHRFTAAAFSPDGSLLATADETSLHIYALPR